MEEGVPVSIDKTPGLIDVATVMLIREVTSLVSLVTSARYINVSRKLKEEGHVEREYMRRGCKRGAMDTMTILFST